jgi:hypothetical protein
MISPFAPVNLPLLDKSQIVDENDPNLLLDPKIGKRPYKRRIQPQPGLAILENQAQSEGDESIQSLDEQ